MVPAPNPSAQTPPADVPATDWFRLGNEEDTPTLERSSEFLRPSPTREPPDWPNVPGYEFLGVLGRGGMGVVYQARHLGLGRTVALKMFLAKANGDPTGQARFRVEAETIAKLQHPNIVQLYDSGTFNGLPYFTLEYVDGGSVRELIRGGAQPPAAAAALLETLARAVYAAHQKGIIHRDLKPANVLLTRDNVPKIADFGLAKRLEGNQALTLSGMIIGTPAYMAPEQLTGAGPVGPEVDIYALGVILYELLAGRLPFEAVNPSDLLFQVSLRDPIAPGYWRPQLPRDLETICLRCLAKNPGDRYPSALALADDLRRFLDGQRITTRTAGPLQRTWRWCRRHPLAVGVMAVGALCMAAVIAALLAGLNGAQQERDQARVERYAALQERDLAWHEREQAELDKQAAEASEARAVAAQKDSRSALDQERKQGQSALDQERKRGQQARTGLDLMTAFAVEDLLPRHPELKAEQRQVLRRTAKVYEELAAESRPDAESRTAAAAAYFRLANIRQRLGENRDAEAAFNKGAAILEKLTVDQPGNRQHRHNLATTYNRLGILLRERDQRDDAEAVFRRALTYQSPIATYPDASPEARENLAAIHVNLGLLYQSIPRLPEAEAEFRHALSIRKNLAAGFRANQSLRRDLASNHNFLAAVLRARGRWDDALAEYRGAAEVLKRLTEEFPANADYRQERALIHGTMGLMYNERHRWNEAEDEYRQALALQEQLVARFPGGRIYALEFGGTNCNFGHMRLDAGRPEESLEWYQNAIRILGPLHEKDKQWEPARRFLRNSYLGRAKAHDALNRFSKAVPDWELVIQLSPDREVPAYRLQLLESIARAADHGRVFKMTGELMDDKTTPAEMLYQLACLCGRMTGRSPKGKPPRDQYAARAVALLIRAQSAGLFVTRAQVERLLKEESLTPLESRGDFQKLLSDLKSKHGIDCSISGP